MRLLVDILSYVLWCSAFSSAIPEVGTLLCVYRVFVFAVSREPWYWFLQATVCSFACCIIIGRLHVGVVNKTCGKIALKSMGKQDQLFLQSWRCQCLPGSSVVSFRH